MSKSNVDPCGVCSLREKAYSVLCVDCDKWIHSGCVREERVTPKFSRNLNAENVKGILERQWSRKTSYVMKWKQ